MERVGDLAIDEPGGTQNDVYVEGRVRQDLPASQGDLCGSGQCATLGDKQQVVRCCGGRGWRRDAQPGGDCRPRRSQQDGDGSLKSWPEPRLWCPTDPHLYQLVTRIESEGREVDRQATRFGFLASFGPRGRNWCSTVRR